MRIDEVNKYCLLHILRGLEAEGKSFGVVYQFVATEAARRGVLDELPGVLDELPKERIL